jgi:hypothetical protein
MAAARYVALAQSVGKPLVLASGRLAVDQQVEPVFPAQLGGSGAFSSSMKASTMADRTSARSRSTVGWISISSPFSARGQCSNRPANVLVGQDRRLGHRRWSALAMVLQDGGDRVVGARAEHQRAAAAASTRGATVAIDQTEDADAGAIPRCIRPR